MQPFVEMLAYWSNDGLVVECSPPVHKVVGSNPRPGLIKDIKSGTWCRSAKLSAL